MKNLSESTGGNNANTLLGCVFIQLKMEQKIKDLENYLNDLDNLIDTGWFPKDSVKECTFYHKDLTLRDFVSKGREYIRQYLMVEKGVS